MNINIYKLAGLVFCTTFYINLMILQITYCALQFTRYTLSNVMCNSVLCNNACWRMTLVTL